MGHPILLGWLRGERATARAKVRQEWLFRVFLDGVLLEEDGDEGSGGDGDEGSDDAGEGGSEEKGDEDGEAHEVDAGAHDAWGEVSILDVDVEDVEEED